MLGKLQEAKDQYSVLGPDRWERLTGEAVILARSGNRAGAEQNIKRMQGIYGDAASYQYAQIYANLGEMDRALASLEHAWSVRDPGLFRIRVDPFFDPLRDNARFEDIVRKMNFPA